MTHICVGKLTIIGSDDGLSPGRRQVIIWTNAGYLLIWPLGTNFNEVLIGIQTFLFKKMHSKMSSAKWGPFCLGLNVLIDNHTNVWEISSRWLIKKSQKFYFGVYNMGMNTLVLIGLDIHKILTKCQNILISEYQLLVLNNVLVNFCGFCWDTMQCVPFWMAIWVHWEKISAILQMTISNAFSWIKMFAFPLTFHWNLFLKVKLTIFQLWFR